MQASFFVQDESTFNYRTGNTSTLNTVAQILLQPDSSAGLQYIWKPAASLAEISMNGTAVPFLMNNTAPCCINLTSRLQDEIKSAAHSPGAPGWKHYASPVSGQVMGTCHIDTTGPWPEVESAVFTWFQDPYNVTAAELEDNNSPLVLMISDWKNARDMPANDPADFGGSSYILLRP